MLDDDERADEDDWFDELDNKVCTFKKKIHGWLRSGEKKMRPSKGSSRSNKSRQSKSSESLRKSQSSRAKKLEENSRIAKLMAEAECIEQRQLAENQSEMLKRAKQEQKFMASMIQNLLMVEVSYQIAKWILLKDVGPEI